MDKFMLAAILREAALWGWVMGAVIFAITLVGVIVDEALLEQIGTGRMGLPFWHYSGVIASPVVAWWFIVYQDLAPVI